MGHTQYKTNLLTKQRFKPQVSAAFGSVSIWIHAYGINPQNPDSVMPLNPPEENAEVSSNAESSLIAQDKINLGGITPAIRDGLIVASMDIIVEANFSDFASQWFILTARSGMLALAVSDNNWLGISMVAE
jgi:hypothetical protein